MVKAVSILLSKLDLDDHTDHMAMSFIHNLHDPPEGFIQVGTALQTHTDHAIDGHELIKSCVIKMVSWIGNLHDSFHENQEHMKANTTIQNMIATLEKHFLTPSTQNPPPQPNNPAMDTYASHTCTDSHCPQ